MTGNIRQKQTVTSPVPPVTVTSLSPSSDRAERRFSKLVRSLAAHKGLSVLETLFCNTQNTVNLPSSTETSYCSKT